MGLKTLDRKQFFEEADRWFCGTNIMLTCVDADSVIAALNELMKKEQLGDCDTVCNGKEQQRAVLFSIHDAEPTIVYALTDLLKTSGYADSCQSKGDTFCCAKNGKRYGGYIAEWERDGFHGQTDCGKYTGRAVITDKESGASFMVGGDGLPRYTYLVYDRMVRRHNKVERVE